jgi:hypothetical protein
MAHTRRSPAAGSGLRPQSQATIDKFLGPTRWFVTGLCDHRQPTESTPSSLLLKHGGIEPFMAALPQAPMFCVPRGS